MRLKDRDLKEITGLVNDGYSPGYIANKYNYDRISMLKIIARCRMHGLKGI